MFGTESKFKCKVCSKDQNHEISIVEIYRINDSDIDYVKLNCSGCGSPHYVAINGYVLEEISVDSKEKKYLEIIEQLGGYPRERFFKDAKFLLKDETVICERDAKEIQSVGVAFF